MSTEYVVISFLVANLVALISILVMLVSRSKAQKIEIRYFEFTEDIAGALKDTRRVIIKGQIHVDNLPVGGQFVVAETSIEKFDYEKLQRFRNQVVMPIAQLGAEAVQLVKGVPIAKAVKFLKR